MVLECQACGQPVSDDAVICPHCAEETGVPADPVAVAMVAGLQASPPPRRRSSPLPLDNHRVEKPPGSPALPRAVAKIKRR